MMPSQAVRYFDGEILAFVFRAAALAPSGRPPASPRALIDFGTKTCRRPPPDFAQVRAKNLFSCVPSFQYCLNSEHCRRCEVWLGLTLFMCALPALALSAVRAAWGLIDFGTQTCRRLPNSVE